jgi:SulP family sulfate permease
MNDWATIRYLWNHRFKTSISEFLITMFATVVFDLTYAIIIGIVVALVLFVVQVSKVEIIVRHVESERMGKNFSVPEDFLLGMRIVYFIGPLYFATGNQLRIKIKNHSNNLHTLILSLRGVPLIDTSGIQIIDDLRLELLTKGCTLKLSGIQPGVEKMLRRSGFIEKIGEDSVFWSADEAIISVTEKMQKDS